MAQLDVLIVKMQSVPDFRSPKGQRYKLHHILTLSILAMISGADDFEAMADFCRMRSAFLEKKGLLKQGRYPSHDLFRWIFSFLKVEAFCQILGSWFGLPPLVESEQEPLELIHIDGKSLRSTRTAEHSRTALQVVSAYLSNFHITIGQLLIDGKSSEKTAIPQMLDWLDIQGCVVTIDAIVGYAATARKIIQGKGDYILALKKNNKIFYEEVKSFFDHFADTPLIADTYMTKENIHGRMEVRKCSTITDLSFFPDAEQWPELKTLVAVEAQRTIRGKTSVETRYYVSSLSSDAKELSQAIRRHWSIENNLHWSLDVAFNEDRARIYHKNAAANMAALRRFALAVLKQDRWTKASIKRKRLRAAWNDDYLEQLLGVVT